MPEKNIMGLLEKGKFGKKNVDFAGYTEVKGS